jgi:putative lipoprotein
MRTSPAAAVLSAALILAATASSLTGCQRGPGESTAPAGAAKPAPSSSPDVPPDAAPQRPTSAQALPSGDVPPPEGVLRAYVWDCDGQLRLRMKNLYRENAITLEMHEGPRKLPQVVSASGAKYSDGSLTFWTKGATATFERQGSAPVNCRESRAESLLADARERGVRYRGSGNEPGWMVEVGPGARLLFVGDYGQQRHEYEAATERAGDQADARSFVAGEGADRIEVTVAKQACADDMSGAAFDHRMVVAFGGATYRGCASELR